MILNLRVVSNCGWRSKYPQNINGIYDCLFNLSFSTTFELVFIRSNSALSLIFVPNCCSCPVLSRDFSLQRYDMIGYF